MTGAMDSSPSIVKVFFTCLKSGDDSSDDVESRDYVVLILALNSKTTSHLLCVPHKDAIHMSLSSHTIQVFSMKLINTINNYFLCSDLS